MKLTFSLAAVSAGEHGEQPGPAERAGTGGERDAEQRPERVRAAVAEHHVLAQVVAEQAGGGAGRTRGDPAVRAAGQRRARAAART